MHLAASEGHLEVVKLLVDEHGADPSPCDRWQGTPLDDAIRQGHEEVCAVMLASRCIDVCTLFRLWAVCSGAWFMRAAAVQHLRYAQVSKFLVDKGAKRSQRVLDAANAKLVEAAAAGDVASVQRAIAEGAEVSRGDYDLRTVCCSSTSPPLAAHSVTCR